MGKKILMLAAAAFVAVGGSAIAQEKTITGGFDVGPGGFQGNFNPLTATAGFTWLTTYYEPLVIYDAGLTKIVTIPCRGEFAGRISDHALLMTEGVRADSAAYRRALASFA